MILNSDDYSNQKERLTPGNRGEKCLCNGEYLEYEIACDNCDYYLLCFPEGEGQFKEE